MIEQVPGKSFLKCHLEVYNWTGKKVKELLKDQK